MKRKTISIVKVNYFKVKMFYFLCSDPSRIKSTMSLATNLLAWRRKHFIHHFDWIHLILLLKTIPLSNCRKVVLFSLSNTLVLSFYRLFLHYLILSLIFASFVHYCQIFLFFFIFDCPKKAFSFRNKLDSSINSQY